MSDFKKKKSKREKKKRKKIYTAYPIPLSPMFVVSSNQCNHHMDRSVDGEQEL